MDIHTAFKLNSGKRRLLVVEDEAVNREMLGAILENDYEVLFAEDGQTALRKLEENGATLSLILLDLILPDMPGIDVLRRIRATRDYNDIPVVVVSGARAQEIDCLNSGASDFIQKPFPEPGVILARVNRAIELFEGRRIIESTEHDPLTGLYTHEYFYSYAEQYDLRHPDREMDAIILDINHFGTINERYGKAYGDEVLRRMGEKAREIAEKDGGIVCRRGADIFQIYCPHRDDYKAILDTASQGIAGELNAFNRVRLRMGVYASVDKSMDLERRFDRAKMAADTVRTSYTRSIAVYDDTLHKSELYSLQLIEDFQRAIDEKQFKVYYQPKYDIQAGRPILAGAEALVRWDHPELGMVSPGVFIPLFEENGLIQTLDLYVWKEASRQYREWLDTLGFAVPVSVNVSRVNMTDPNLVYTFLSIVEENRLEAPAMHLEVTESAYAEDADQIIETVTRFRSMGFNVEMDDFGTGYSSLNMLSTLPIDILKLDMTFLRTAFSREKDLHMLGIIVEIARHLSVPVVAEGVETEEQLSALRDLGCDMVQGYYFSPPVPADKFEPFLIKERDADAPAQAQTAGTAQDASAKKRVPLLQEWSRRLSLSMSRVSIVFLVLSLIIAGFLFASNTLVNRGYSRMEESGDRYVLAMQSASDLEMGSDLLTEAVRSFVVKEDMADLNAYFEEAQVTKRRDTALSNLEALLPDKETQALEHLSTALSYSNELMNQEYLAMRCILSTMEPAPADLPEVLEAVQLSPDQQALSPQEKKDLAIDLAFGDTYDEYKQQIQFHTGQCTQELITQLRTEQERSERQMILLLTIQTVLTIIMLILVFLTFIFINAWIRKPLNNMVDQMRSKRTVEPSGAAELRFVAETYNSIFEENRKTHERLNYNNMHDALTGLYNRSAYDFMRHDLDMSRNALLLVDVDKFKSVNDTYGHDVGDLVLKRVAEVLKYSFRATDLVFRLGGDEFVVIMANVDSGMRDAVRTKIEQANVMLQNPNGDLPPTSLSVGVAFGDRENPEGDIFKDADTALYRMKEGGRCGCVIY